jgi:hypothetical protein
MKMKTLLLFLTIITSCTSPEPENRESWRDLPQAQWPQLALTNNVKFSNADYPDLANAFLIDTGFDTLAVTAKHLFLIFQRQGLQKIDLGDDFLSWHMYPRNKPEHTVAISELINRNPKEDIGQFRTLKDRDWLLFRIEGMNPALYPLKIRLKPVSKGESVYAIGWAKDQSSEKPSVIEMKVYRNKGNYYYIETITDNVNPVGRSGSPVIDKNGFLVGLVSGAEGNLGVIGSTDFLKQILATHGLAYAK